MVCHICQSETRISNSRPQKRSNQVWRRRQCTLCDATFTTLEAIDYSKLLLVQRSGKRRMSPLLRDRLFLSLYKSLGHRPTALTDAGELTITIITKVAKSATNSVVPVEHITETSLVALTRFDKLAAQHYQAFHRL